MRLEEIAKIKTYYCSLNFELLDECRSDLKSAFTSDLNTDNDFDKRILKNFETFASTLYFSYNGEHKFPFINEQETV